MEPSLQKLQKFFKLEAERGYDNHAVLGGLERMLEHWEAEARAEGVSEDLIRAVNERIRDYSHLTAKSRAETLEGLSKRIQKQEVTIPSRPSDKEIPEPVSEPVPPDQTEPDIHDFPPQDEPQSNRLTEKRKTSSPNHPPAAPLAAGEPAALNASIVVLPGIGSRHAQTLGRLGLYTLRDMLYHFPRRYDDYTLLKPINRLRYGDEVTVIGTVQSVATRPLRGGQMQLVEVILTDGSGSLRVNWFNQPWVAKRLNKGAHIVISGKIDQYLGRLTMNSPEWEPLEQQQLSTNRIVPVYPLTAQITQRWLRKMMDQVVSYWAARVQDPLPESLRNSAGLFDLPRALSQIHFPDSWDSLKKARDRLAFDEILLLQLGVLRQKRTWQERTGRVFRVEDGWLEDRLAGLPYALTTAQQRVLSDIRHDLESGRPMNRLLQGDVGSGKTIIAALAIAIITEQGAQAAIMAPTSILAEQHYRTLLNVLAGTDLSQEPDISQENPSPAASLKAQEIRLMIGATPEAEKREIREGLANGSIKLVIGTHALIEDPVLFSDLQFIVMDEQHRFGVEQRAALRAKGNNPHLLVMTATPIPRSLALTIYGDLDLSVMDEMPPGRQPVDTYVLMPRERERVYSLIRTQVKQGQQAYIIYPLVEESEKSEAKAAVEEQARLQKEIFPELHIGLLHGRLPPEEKETVMASFRDGKIHILVSTTVIEVGVDVPNATIMLVEGANRFGLAQLHQLRGRVGRGSEKSYCVLIPETPDEAENERLQVMTETNDGFILAERDLEQRGPGQFLGTRQAGYAEFQVANLTDIHLIENARRHAQALFEQDPDLSQSEHQLLSIAFKRSWSTGRGDIS